MFFEKLANAIGVILLLIMLASFACVMVTFAIMMLKDLIKNWNK